MRSVFDNRWFLKITNIPPYLTPVNIKQIIDRFSGDDYLSYYDRHRPSAPRAMVDCALRYAKMEHADLVVDIGCGTGLSTYIWQDCANSVVGIDPSPDMLVLAAAHCDASVDHVRFADGLGHQIPVEDGSVDIVSCGQVFHWMDTVKTLAEVQRILRPGGVFVVYDCAWPPSFEPVMERAYIDFFIGIHQIAEGFNSELVIGHMKEKHHDNIASSGNFDFIRDMHFHKAEHGSLERFEGILLSQGGVHALLRKGLTEDEIGLTQFRKSIRSVSDVPDQMTFHFKSIFAIKEI